MICKVSSADIRGTSAFSVCVEADVAGGLPGFYMVGLPSSEVREAKERVIRAIINSGFDFPARKVTINLSPAYLRKKGSGLDLPIAVAILTALDVISEDAVKRKLFIGELSLDGSINAVKGILPIAVYAKNEGFESIVVPKGNEFEGAVVDGIRIHGASDLKGLVRDLNRNVSRDVEHIDLNEAISRVCMESELDYSDIIGQENAKMATLVAASGFHNILYIGPPGSGKSMIAQRIPTIFGQMSAEECLEVSMIYSIAGLLENEKLMFTRPFRSPDQSITDAALVGGTANPRPGEITLAHRGVLFLDELAEFRKSTIDLLRVPLETGKTVISRANERIEYPCRFMFAAATNPCKCGFYPDRTRCSCTESDVNRYLNRIRGPILDRIDICVGVSRVKVSELDRSLSGISSEEMRELAGKARKIQEERFKGLDINFNSQMNRKQADEFCIMEKDAKEALSIAYERFQMTARGWYKILKVSRTIADLEGTDIIKRKHVIRAIGYRNTFINRRGD